MKTVTKAVFYTARLPKSLNQLLRSHWTARSREQKAWDDVVGANWISQGRPVFLLPVTLSFILNFPGRRARDLDNYIGGTKYVIDALKRSFLFRDDAEWIKKIELEIRRAVPGNEGMQIVIQAADGVSA